MIELNTVDRRLDYVGAFRTGMNAYCVGSKKENNPFKQGTIHHMGWAEGWDLAYRDWLISHL